MEIKEIARKMFNKTDCLKLKKIIQAVLQFIVLFFIICFLIPNIVWDIYVTCAAFVVFIGVIIKILVS